MPRHVVTCKKSNFTITKIKYKRSFGKLLFYTNQYVVHSSSNALAFKYDIKINFVEDSKFNI